MGSWIDNRWSATDRPACTTRSRTSCSTDDYSRIPSRSENNWRRTGCLCSLDGCTSLHNHNEDLNKSTTYYFLFNCLMYCTPLKPHFPRNLEISQLKQLKLIIISYIIICDEYIEKIVITFTKYVS